MRWSARKRKWQGVAMRQHLLKVRALDRSRSLGCTDGCIYGDGAGNEARGISLLHVYRNDALTGDLLRESRQILLSGIHLRGKEFSLLSSKNRRCESIGWINL
jgi:hypothetical protein